MLLASQRLTQPQPGQDFNPSFSSSYRCACRVTPTFGTTTYSSESVTPSAAAPLSKLLTLQLPEESFQGYERKDQRRKDAETRVPCRRFPSTHPTQTYVKPLEPSCICKG